METKSEQKAVDTVGLLLQELGSIAPGSRVAGWLVVTDPEKGEVIRTIKLAPVANHRSEQLRKKLEDELGFDVDPRLDLPTLCDKNCALVDDYLQTGDTAPREAVLDLLRGGSM